jgi:potassium-transporting ATPase potassium-binding subunit
MKEVVMLSKHALGLAVDPRQGRALLVAMAILFVGALIVFYWSEARGNPILTALGVDPSLGNMEGKDLRFGQAGLALFAQATTGTGTGASNGVLESMTPLSGMAALFNLLLGCIRPAASARDSTVSYYSSSSRPSSAR